MFTRTSPPLSPCLIKYLPCVCTHTHTHVTFFGGEFTTYKLTKRNKKATSSRVLQLHSIVRYGNGQSERRTTRSCHNVANPVLVGDCYRMATGAMGWGVVAFACTSYIRYPATEGCGGTAAGIVGGQKAEAKTCVC